MWCARDSGRQEAMPKKAYKFALREGMLAYSFQGDS